MDFFSSVFTWKLKFLTCLSKEAFENGIGAEDFLVTGVDGDHGVGLGLLEED